MKYQDMQELLLACIRVWTEHHNPWHYVAEKITACANEFEHNCNNQIITAFRLWQFSEVDQEKVMYQLNEEIKPYLQNASQYWDTKWSIEFKAFDSCEKQFTELIETSRGSVCENCRDELA